MTDETKPFWKYDVGTILASTQDEVDDDHCGRVRTTPAGSLWEVTAIDRYTYAESPRNPAGSVCAYTLGCPATGGMVVPYAPIDGEPFGHHRDEMANFIPIDLPGQTWPTLRQQLVALCEIKDAIADAIDQRTEAMGTVESELRKAGLLPATGT